MMPVMATLLPLRDLPAGSVPAGMPICPKVTPLGVDCSKIEC
jgi:hypothetical protein